MKAKKRLHLLPDFEVSTDSCTSLNDNSCAGAVVVFTG